MLSFFLLQFLLLRCSLPSQDTHPPPGLNRTPFLCSRTFLFFFSYPYHYMYVLYVQVHRLVWLIQPKTTPCIVLSLPTSQRRLANRRMTRRRNLKKIIYILSHPLPSFAHETPKRTWLEIEKGGPPQPHTYFSITPLQYKAEESHTPKAWLERSSSEIFRVKGAKDLALGRKEDDRYFAIAAELHWCIFQE